MRTGNGLPEPEARIFFRWVVQYNKIRYDRIRYDTIRYDTIRYDTVRNNAVIYDMPTIQYHSFQVSY